jgi:opacity protein-like surface antigen
LYGVGVDYNLNNNSFIGFSFYETQMNKEKFTVSNDFIVDTKLKYNTAKFTYNYRF